MLYRAVVFPILGIVLLGLGACATPAAPLSTPQPTAAPTSSATLPRIFSSDPQALADDKAKFVAGDKSAASAVDFLLFDADRALRFEPVSVMDKKIAPPSNDMHDYVSMAPYWWPDPTKPNGLPYVRKDGQTNPEIHSAPDKDAIVNISSNVVKNNRIVTANIPHDWSKYQYLSFWMYSGEANKTSVTLVTYSETEPTQQNYFNYKITLDWTGWKFFEIGFKEFTNTRAPVGWQKIDSLKLASTGRSQMPYSTTLLYFDAMKLTNTRTNDQ
jgi:hypothetical protein